MMYPQHTELPKLNTKARLGDSKERGTYTGEAVLVFENDSCNSHPRSAAHWFRLEVGPEVQSYHLL